MTTIDRDLLRNWMWSEACEVLARAERLHSEFYRLAGQTTTPNWVPPVDVVETEGEVVVLVALPGVGQDQIEARIEGQQLIVAGTRFLPANLRTAKIHRLELPQGRFERVVPLPAGTYAAVERTTLEGCLVIILRKSGGSRG